MLCVILPYSVDTESTGHISRRFIAIAILILIEENCSLIQFCVNDTGEICSEVKSIYPVHSIDKMNIY